MTLQAKKRIEKPNFIDENICDSPSTNRPMRIMLTADKQHGTSQRKNCQKLHVDTQTEW